MPDRRNSHNEFGEVVHELPIEEVGLLQEMLLELLVDGLRSHQRSQQTQSVLAALLQNISQHLITCLCRVLFGRV